MKSGHNDSKSPSHLHWASPAAAVTTGLLTSNLAVYQDNRMTECGRYWYCGIRCWGGKLLSNIWQALMKPQPLIPATCIMFPQSSASSMGRGVTWDFSRLFYCGAVDHFLWSYWSPATTNRRLHSWSSYYIKGRLKRKGGALQNNGGGGGVRLVIKVNSLRKGKMSKMRLFLNFWSFTVTKRFDFFKLISLYWLIYFLLEN